ncbi:uncharacterized protein HMPREF1120_02709 [Exophiala dermatitidis NIH/UT8656]|uniref:Uncharacterized protein n=1 Tax=Exophiala dermatitidis (strain ATCC 34100 / CBS 525.76 / NIH/UT8656) TaxID=858893 RepID=H6BQE8_EXODN|nr:uncharacterized protein HMPREF1120_02709 [Exophiala dermatitidis NIH/UT8656]EHY54541.1 hypothetical protein HMPREF1120_02709 [Exophiala dermatitidis NIH/UT8656]
MILVQTGMSNGTARLRSEPLFASVSKPREMAPLVHSHRNHLSQRSDNGQITQPAEEISINEPGWSTVGQAVHEDRQKALPGNHEGAGEPEHAHEAKVALSNSISRSRRNGWRVSLTLSS